MGNIYIIEFFSAMKKNKKVVFKKMNAIGDNNIKRVKSVSER